MPFGRKLVRSLGRIARTANDVTALARRNPRRIARRFANKWIGRKIGRRLYL